MNEEERRSKQRGASENMRTDLMRLWPIFAFLIAYGIGGIWWAATVQADQEALQRSVLNGNEAKDLAVRHEVLIPEIQKTLVELRNQQLEMRTDQRTFQGEMRNDIKEIMRAVKS